MVVVLFCTRQNKLDLSGLTSNIIKDKNVLQIGILCTLVGWNEAEEADIISLP
ncbi:13419_t:CDS:2 [Funneliformis mosseae]|uniref:13419_t:CDS:1 n=1 Tax=Funneliformis mosseae TaxID=27381 RepID=A0A9N9B4E5_FUNMO|nr:13419_t:CDS:2 [Funneliformis mosseae]